MKAIRRLAVLPLAAILLILLQTSCDELITETNTVTLTDSTLAIGCFDCHNDEDNLLLRPRGQFDNSAHANHAWLDATVNLNGDLIEVNDCGGRCHTHEEFLKVFDDISINPTTYSAITCFTCHMPHPTDPNAYGDWDADTLRALSDVVTLSNGAAYVFGKSNMCAHCHQAYEPSSKITGDDYFLGGAFGPHFSPQSEVLIGTGGHRFGSDSYTNTHDLVGLTDGCLKCHYGKGQGYTFGEHTFRLETEGGSQYIASCNVAGCHSTSPITDFYDFPDVDTIGILADSLKVLLTIRGILDPLDPSGTTFFGNQGVASDEARMLYNYLLYRLDGSDGIHNPGYMKVLLQETVDQYAQLPPNTAFSADVLYGCLTLDVQFTDESEGNVTSWAWDFGDGTGTSIEANPLYTYTAPGTYTVTLTATGPGGSNQVVRTDYITVDDAPVAGFVYDNQIGCAETQDFTINFTDQSTGVITDYLWDFGDGGTSADASPQHDFAPGVYAVSLTVTSACGQNTYETPGTDSIYIYAGPPVAAPSVQFIAGLQAQFLDNSTDAVSWSWDFGDGSEPSAFQQPDHTFPADGTYDVTLTVTNPCGEDSETIQVTVSSTSQ